MRPIKSLVIILVICCLACSNREAKENALKDLETYQSKLSDFTAMLEGTQNRLKTLQQDLVVAQDQLNQVGSYQLLRTESEREQQLRDATASIQDIQQNIQDAQQMVGSLGDSLQNTQVRIDAIKEKLKN